MTDGKLVDFRPSIGRFVILVHIPTATFATRTSGHNSKHESVRWQTNYHHAESVRPEHSQFGQSVRNYAQRNSRILLVVQRAVEQFSNGANVNAAPTADHIFRCGRYCLFEWTGKTAWSETTAAQRHLPTEHLTNIVFIHTQI